MKHKLPKLVALLLAILVIVIVAIPTQALYYMNFSGAGNTTHQLEQFLAALEWDKEYEQGVFDCSNMAARLCGELREEGFRCVMAVDNGHVWIMVKTKEGIRNVESVYLKPMTTDKRPWYVLHPSLGVLVAPLAGFDYSGKELVEKPTPEQGWRQLWRARKGGKEQ